MNIFSQALRQIRIGITVFISKIRYTQYPFFVVYNLAAYKFDDTYTVLDLVQPGDILLRAYDNYLDSLFIPGVWKHAAVAIDNRNVVQALGHGVEQDDIVQFCRTDHVQIMRFPNITPAQVNDIVAYAKAQIGKPYDYDFLISNANKFYCSELVIDSYNSVETLLNITPKGAKLLGFLPTWPVISPDDLANCPQLITIYKSN